MFDLEKEVQAYCRAVYSRWYDREEHYQEMKDHIYSAVDQLKQTGLTEEQAFYEATKQLGSVEELKRENSKNRNRLSVFYELADWRFPMNPKKAAILHIVLGLLFAGIVIPVDWIIDHSAYARYSNEVTNVMLGLYMIPFFYLSFAVEQEGCCVSGFTFVKRKVAGVLKNK